MGISCKPWGLRYALEHAPPNESKGIKSRRTCMSMLSFSGRSQHRWLQRKYTSKKEKDYSSEKEVCSVYWSHLYHHNPCLYVFIIPPFAPFHQTMLLGSCSGPPTCSQTKPGQAANTVQKTYCHAAQTPSWSQPNTAFFILMLFSCCCPHAVLWG